MSLATNLEYLMQLQRITPQELADNIKIDRSTLTRILNGSTAQPRLETIYTLAKYFNVNPNNLLNNEYNKEFKVDSSLAKREIGEILSDLMAKTGIISLSLLHKYSEIPISVLSDILNGKTEKPNIKTLQKLANLFNLTITQLLGSDPILDSQLTRINLTKKSIPLLPFSAIANWFSHQTEPNLEGTELEYITVNRAVINEKAFSINISSDSFEPDFLRHQILIIDIIEPESGDFIIASVNNQTSIYEYEIENKSVYLREAGTSQWINTKSLNITIYGVVIQQIINRK